MRLTVPMILAMVQEYYNDPMKRGYFASGNMNKDGKLEFYVPQIVYLANGPIECIDINLPRNVKHCMASRTSIIFEGIEGAPNAITSEDVIDAFEFFYKYIRPDDTPPFVLKE